MSDNLSQLLATPLQPLREEWRSSDQKDRLRGRGRSTMRVLTLRMGGRGAALDATVGRCPDG